LSLIKIMCLWIMKNMLYVIVILFSLSMKLLKIIMREENMVVEICMVLKHLSICWKFWSYSCFIFLCLSLCSSWIYLCTRFLCIGSGLDLNVFWICFLMLSFASTLISWECIIEITEPILMAIKKALLGR
jgi:hypothetical protein